MIQSGSYPHTKNLVTSIAKYIINKKAINDRKSYETNFKLERSPLLFLNGNIRDYSRFRTDFTHFTHFDCIYPLKEQLMLCDDVSILMFKILWAHVKTMLVKCWKD